MTIKSISMPLGSWPKIYNQLAKDYPPSVIIVREKMRRVLGFTTRTYKRWTSGMVSYDELMILDFYDEKKKTMFLLRYSHLLTDSET